MGQAHPKKYLDTKNIFMDTFWIRKTIQNMYFSALGYAGVSSDIGGYFRIQIQI